MTSNIALRLAALAVGALAVSGQCAHAAVPPPPAEAAHRIQLDHISAEVVGRGPPVLLIPGLANPRAVWADFVPRLAQSHRVYLIEVNGFGGTDPRKNLAPGLLEGIVGDLDGLVRAEKLDRPAIVGHSMGGLVGLLLATKHPEDLGRLMIVDSLPFFGVLAVPPGTEATVATVEPGARAMREAIAAAYGKPVDPARTAAQVAGLALKPESRAKMEAWAAAADARVTSTAFYEDMTTDLRPALAKIQTPITLVYPWSAAAFGKERTDAFYRRNYAAAPHVTYVPIGEAAHFVMLDQPDAFRAALAAFLGDG
ncbi:MAG: alpha/beta fold hydrolase [Allosphingosinicella sp.]